ncbi:MAG: ATP-binding protein [Senegalimassilia sp.]|nr:ATP-binding protein [Senegalimassilia sp.]
MIAGCRLDPERARALRHAEIVKRSGIPQRYARLIEVGELRPRPEIARAVADGRTVVLWGPKGRGKTAAACAAAYAFVDAHLKQMTDGDSILFAADVEPAPTGAAKRYVRARFTTSAAFVAETRSAIGRPGADPAEVVDRYARCSLLVLDDLAKEASSTSTWPLSQLWQLVNARYAEQRPMIVTTQYDPDSLAGALAAGSSEMLPDAGALVDRLMEDGAAICFGGPNLRRAGPA